MGMAGALKRYGRYMGGKELLPPDRIHFLVENPLIGKSSPAIPARDEV